MKYEEIVKEMRELADANPNRKGWQSAYECVALGIAGIKPRRDDGLLCEQCSEEWDDENDDDTSFAAEVRGAAVYHPDIEAGWDAVDAALEDDEAEVMRCLLEAQRVWASDPTSP